MRACVCLYVCCLLSFLLVCLFVFGWGFGFVLFYLFICLFVYLLGVLFYSVGFFLLLIFFPLCKIRYVRDN